jgi:hypothetical protein
VRRGPAACHGRGRNSDAPTAQAISLCRCHWLGGDLLPPGNDADNRVRRGVTGTWCFGGIGDDILAHSGRQDVWHFWAHLSHRIGKLADFNKEREEQADTDPVYYVAGIFADARSFQHATV